MFTTDLCLRALPAPCEWALTEPLIWQTPDQRIEVPALFVTDLASIPQVFQNVLSVTGRSRRAAVLHDFSYCQQQLSRAECDALLRTALIAEGMPALAAGIYWSGVRIGGWRYWNARLARGGGLQRDDFLPRGSVAVIDGGQPVSVSP